MVRKAASPPGRPNRNRVVGKKKFGEFVRRHPGLPGAKKGLHRWADLVESTSFDNFADVRRTFPSASKVGRKTVFNVRSNHIRVITLVVYKSSAVIVQDILTHREYDDGGWRD